MIEDLKRENELLRTILDLMGQVEHWKAKWDKESWTAAKYRQLCHEMLNNGVMRYAANNEFSQGVMHTYNTWIDRAKNLLRNEKEEEFFKLLKHIEDEQASVREMLRKMKEQETRSKKGRAPKPGTIV